MMLFLFYIEEKKTKIDQINFIKLQITTLLTSNKMIKKVINANEKKVVERRHTR
jgi:hypothetical protein